MTRDVGRRSLQTMFKWNAPQAWLDFTTCFNRSRQLILH